MIKRIVSGIWVLAVCSSMFGFFVVDAGAQTIADARSRRLNNLPGGLTFRLSEGSSDAAVRVKQQLTPADPLPAGDAAALLERLPDITSATDDQTDFAKRIGTLPAPKTGKQIPVKFPSVDQRGTPKVDPGTSLGVVRFSPEGEVSLAPDLSVTFSQPMVAVTSQEAAANYAPVEMSPQVEGRWRWLGTRTLMFDTDKRFPMATKFTLRVPAGTRSANGQTLAKDVVWTFTTPAPKVEQMFPQNQVTRRDALIFISFDQSVEPGAVLGTTTVLAGGRRIATRLATQSEIDADPNVSYFTKQAQPGRWLVLRATNADGSVENALPPASTITVSVNAGTPSAEGPLRTQKAQPFKFTTYRPFKFSKAWCGWEQNKNCSPFHDWYLQFNNPIDAAKFTSEMFRVEPPVEGLKMFPSGSLVYIQGYKKGRTTYKITVDASLPDTFGQTLGQPSVATIRVDSAEPNIYSQGGPMVVLDPFGSRSYSVYSTNYSSVRVRMYAVDPKDWAQYLEYYRRLNYDDGKRPAIPGTLVSEKIMPVATKPDELGETRIDVTPALKNGFRNVIIDVEPVANYSPALAVRAGRQHRVVAWIQSTQIGLDAFVDSQEMVAFATELRSGRPMAGVELSIYPNDASKGEGLSRSISEGSTLSWIDWAWNLVTGSGGPNADEIESFDANGAEIESTTVPEAQTKRTGADGVLRLSLPDTQKGPNILIARRGNDVAFLPENSDYYWNDHGNWARRPDVDSLRWFVFDDRKMYRPKEQVAVKGYIRRVTGGKLGDIEMIGDAVSGFTWSVKDSRENEIASGTGNLNAFGAFDLKFTLPDNANLGDSRIDFQTTGTIGGGFAHQFQIQEFRRPEFEVTAKVDSPAPHFVGGKADVSVEAKYYAGGPLSNAETNWTVRATPTSYAPPNRGDYIFGTWVPWWGTYDRGDYVYHGGGTTQTFKGVTGSDGRHQLKIDFDSVNPPRPYNVTASAAVQDVNRQTWSSAATLLVHPAELYVGIKSPRTFVQKDEKIVVESIVTDLDGKLIAGREINIKAVLRDWQFDKGSWSEVVVDEQTCSVRSAEVGVQCEFVAKQGGRYTITATIMDDRERLNESEFIVWVPGGKQPPKRNIEQETVQIIPSKKDHAPGEVAELLIIAPFTPAEGVLTLRREGIVKTERFSMKDSSMTLKILLEEKYLPNIHAQVDLVGAAPRQNDKGEADPKLPQRPAFATGNIDLSISTASRKLTVVAEPQDKTLVPGGTTKVGVEVKDSSGEPVANSEVAIVVVDESVLALSAYRIPDPLSIFYLHRGTGVTDFHLRGDVLLGNPDDVKPPPPPAGGVSETVDVSAAAPTGSLASQVSARRFESKMRADANGFVGGKDQASDPIALRQNFNALAVFAPSLKTDANGRVVVDVKLPDNLTRYRITAVAVDTGKRFGSSESSITAKQPLMVRPSAPRFMNFGDKIDLPVVVQNQTDQDMTVSVAVRATNASISDFGSGIADSGSPSAPLNSNSAGKRILVKANSREEVRFPAAAVKAGIARFQIVATAGKFSDAAEISLPVWTPATTEAFATYGTTDENGAIIQPVQAPGGVFPQFGGLEVTTSSTQLQELTDAFIYLANYPYGCSEQIASRIISIAAMRDVLAAFKSKDMPDPKELEAQFARDIAILESRQRDDGSFGLWKRERERYEFPFLTVHVAHALVLAKAKGYKVPDEMLNKTKPYLKDIEKHFDDEWYKNSPKVRWTISAYALYVRDLMGDKDAGKAKRLLTESAANVPDGGNLNLSETGRRFEAMPFEALGWVLSVLSNDKDSAIEVDSIVRFLMNRTTETAAAANFITNYADGGWLIMHSNRRADGVLLESLIRVRAARPGEPSAVQSNDLIPKLVRGLLAHRTKGHWGSTQENVFILLALDKYFHAFESVTPNFVTRVWLGQTYAGEEVFRGRSVDSNVLNIPMSYLIDQGGTSNLLIDRQGAGRLYYRIGMKYAPKNLRLDPADYGFTILRKYEPVDDPADVKQNADGSWAIKSGARVRVRLTMVAQARRYHVALVDNLPAGLEILNPSLAVTEAVPPDTGGNTGVATYSSRSYGRGHYYWRQYWFEHQNFRDERAEAFSALLWEGVYNYSYVARATTPGEFVVPPAKAEEMYHPETFGRTGTGFVRVE